MVGTTKVQKTLNAAAATGAGTAVRVNPGKIGVHIAISNTATAKVETSPDGGSTWVDTSITAKTASGYFVLDEVHALIRGNVTAFTSGTINMWVSQADS